MITLLCHRRNSLSQRPDSSQLALQDHLLVPPQSLTRAISCTILQSLQGQSISKQAASARKPDVPHPFQCIIHVYLLIPYNPPNKGHFAVYRAGSDHAVCRLSVEEEHGLAAIAQNCISLQVTHQSFFSCFF